MSESKSVRAWGVLGAVVAATVCAVGCSDGAPAQGGSAPAVDVDKTLSTQTIRPNTPCQNSSCLLTAAAPISATCPGATSTVLSAKLVLALHANLDLAYYPDGYGIRFPTPWVDSVNDPAPDAYEDRLLTVAPSAGFNPNSRLRREYLVHEISAYKPPYTWTETGRDWFFVGIGNSTDANAASNLAAQYPNYLPEVEAHIAGCVRVLKINSNGYVYDTGEWHWYYDEHDPINPPN